MSSSQSALAELMLGIAALASALVTGSEFISSITSMLLATFSGLGQFSISSKCSFHLSCLYFVCQQLVGGVPSRYGLNRCTNSL